jgi:hypothetical protein
VVLAICQYGGDPRPDGLNGFGACSVVLAAGPQPPRRQLVSLGDLLPAASRASARFGAPPALAFHGHVASGPHERRPVVAQV